MTPKPEEKPDPEAVAASGVPITDTPEESSAPSQERLGGYLSQVLLRVLNASPGVASYLESYRINPEGDAIEVSFYKLPDDMINAISSCFGIHDVEVYHYTKGSHPCTGYKATPTRDELSALAVDDADDHQLKKKEADASEKQRVGDVEKSADAFLEAPELT